MTQLQPETLAAFEAYSAKVESSLHERWAGKRAFLDVEDNALDLKRCLGAQLLVRQLGEGSAVQIRRGLIHDWLGSVYIPHTTMERVLNVLEDFNRHKDIYPEVEESQTLTRVGHTIQGRWRLHQKGLVPVVLDVDQSVRYLELSPGKWSGEAYARKIIEHESGPFARGRKYGPDQGHGYLWRLYSYWSLEVKNGGVLAECRTLSLSRDIPAGLGWAVGPFVQKKPETSLTSTLNRTREAATER